MALPSRMLGEGGAQRCASRAGARVIFFLVAGWKMEELDGPAALAHYRQRGTFEDRLGEFQQAIRPHLSHNLASTLRIEYEAAAGSCFDLGRFQRDVLKAGGRVVEHARRLVLQVARVVAPFWERLIAGLERWKLPARFPTPHGAHHHAWRPPPRHAFLHEVRRC